MAGQLPKLDGNYSPNKSYFDQIKIGICISEWNPEITNALLQGAMSIMSSFGFPESNIIRLKVPGSYELALGAQILIEKHHCAGVITLGCIIKGDTIHDAVIAHALGSGVMNTGLKFNKPIIFGVITCNTRQEAIDRSGGKHGNKGIEAAIALFKMLDLSQS